MYYILPTSQDTTRSAVATVKDYNSVKCKIVQYVSVDE